MCCFGSKPRSAPRITVFRARKGKDAEMDWGPPRVWEDGDTLLTSGDDRAGALLIAIFASILALYIVPELLKRFRTA
jgi:hypothetical protein